MTGTDITFDSAGCPLAGTYLEAASPVAAALLISGSGKTDRNPDVALPLGQQLRTGSARPGGEVLAWQTEQLAPRLPRSAKAILRLLRTDAIRAQRKNQDRIMASSGDAVRVQGTKVAARWFRDFVRYDPALALSRLSVPVLAITGGNDLQVPPADIETMGKLVPGPFDGHVVGDLSHMFRPDPGCAGPRGYRRAGRTPMSAEVLTLITGWVTRHWVEVAR